MDQISFDRWQHGQPPFDGNVLCPKDLLPINDMREILVVAVEQLRMSYGDFPIIVFDCWHGHDAYISPRRQATWEDLEKNLSSNEALFQSRDDDEFVHRAYYDSIGGFLLRYDIPDDDLYLETHGIVGTFDLAAPIALLKGILDRCPDRLAAKLQLEDAKRYFDERYAG